MRARMMLLGAIAPIAAALAPVCGRAAVQLSGVAAGTAAISQRGAVTNIRTSNNAILNFSQFNIPVGSTVDFIQPSAASRELNRISSAAPSAINGSLISNGTVYLVNPAGVIFGPGAVINVNQIYAAGAYISNQDFLAGNNHFTGVSGMVSNSGQISANGVYLVGSQVLNQGTIVAPGGLVAMVAGSDVLLGEEDSHIVAKVIPLANASSASAAGSAPADLRSSPMAAGDVYSMAIRHTGSIVANNVLINGGGAQVQVSGSINASSATPGTSGGTIEITGGQVELTGATIDATGPAGGGGIYIGGLEHGAAGLDPAQYVSADSNTTIDADATSNGNGGTVVLWSTNTTDTSAALTARGGPGGGNGGFIETSGEDLSVGGTAPNASAPHGDAGTWLMDPIDITIVNNATATGSFTGSSTINNSLIVATLNLGTSVAIQTNNTTNGSDTGTLTQNTDAIIGATIPSGAVTLTLQGQDTMTLGGGITNNGAGTLNVEIDQLSGPASAVVINTVPININGTLKILGGAVTTSVGLTAQAVTIASGTTTIGSTSVTTGTVSIGGAIATTGGAFTGGGSTFSVITGGSISTAGGAINISPSAATSIAGALSSGGGPITGAGISFTTTTGGTISSANGNVVLDPTGPVSLAAAVTTGTGSFTSNGLSFTSLVGGTITTTGGAVTLTPPSGTVTVGDEISTGGGAFTSTSESFTETAEITDGGVGTAAGTMSISTTQAGGTGAISISSPISWTAGVTSNRAVLLQAGGGITIAATGSISATSGGALPISLYTTLSGGPVAVNGIISTTGPFISAGGNFSVGNPNATPAPTIIAASSITINTATAIPGGAAVSNGTVSINGPIVSTGTIAIGGITSFTTGGSGSLTSTGAITITNTGTVTIDTPVATNGGNLTATMNSGFTTGATSTTTLGTITTSGGSIVLSGSSAPGVTIGETVNTGGGAFTATGFEFTDSGTITDGGLASPPSNDAFTVNTTASTGPISITAAIIWTGGTGRSVLIEGGANISISSAGSITESGSGALPISLYTTGSGSAIDVNGVIDTNNGAFTAAGGAFTIGEPSATPPPTILTATTASINTATATPGGTAVTNGAVQFSGPIVTNGALTVGGTAEFTENEDGTVTTHGGAYVINNSGEISIGAAVNTGGGAFDVPSCVLFTAEDNGSINTGGGALTVTTTSTSSSEGATFNSAIDTVGGAFTVSTIVFSGTGAITDGGQSLANGAFSVTTPAADVALANQGDASLGTFGFDGAISWAGGTGRSITIVGGTDIDINAPITSTGTTPLPVRIDTSGSGSNVEINAPIDISGAFVSDGGNFSMVTGTASTGSVTALTFSLNTNPTTATGVGVTPGAMILQGPIVTHGAVTLDAATITQSQGGNITSNGGAVSMNTDNPNNPGEITVGSPIITGGGEYLADAGDTFTAAGSGNIATNGGEVSISANNELEIASTISTGGGSFITNSPEFDIVSGGVVTDGGVANTNPNGFIITVPNDAIDIDGNINWAASTSPLQFDYGVGTGVVLTGTIAVNPAVPLTFASGALALNGGAATIIGGNITIGTVLVNSGTTSPLTIDSSGVVSLSGNLGSTSTPIGTLTVAGNNSAAPTTTLNGVVFSNGDVIFGGTLDLTGISTVEDVSTGSQTIEFNGAIEGPSGLSVFMEGTDDDIIRLNNDVGNVTPVAYMNLFPGQLGLVGIRWGTGFLPPPYPEQQPATTIDIASGGTFEVNDENPSPRNFSSIDSTIDSFGPLTINIGAGQAANSANTYAVGVNEKLAVFGPLNINVNGGTIQTGDISTTGNMSLEASTVRLMLRGPTTDGNTTVDSGMDLISLAQISLPANAQYIGVKESNGLGTIDDPGFVANSFNPASNIASIAGKLNTAYSFIGLFSPSTLFGQDNLLIDYAPSTFTSSSIPSFVPPIPGPFDYPLAGAYPRQWLTAGNVPTDFKLAYQVAYPGPIQEQDLNDTGLYTRDVTTEEIVDATGTMVVYEDVPQRPRPKPSDYKAVTPRLDPAQVQIFLKAYNQAFGADPQARKQQMASDIQSAWDSYATQNGGQNLTGAGFAQYCATTSSAGGAYGDLVALRQVRGSLATLGLSYKEAQVAFQYNMLAGMRANGMRAGDLAEAVANTNGK